MLVVEDNVLHMTLIKEQLLSCRGVSEELTVFASDGVPGSLRAVYATCYFEVVDVDAENDLKLLMKEETLPSDHLLKSG